MDDAERGANAIITDRSREAGDPRAGRRAIHFDVDPFRKHCLLNGLDDIGLTLEKAASIDSFEARPQARALAVGRLPNPPLPAFPSNAG